MFRKRYKFTANYRLACFVNVGFRPSEVVTFHVEFDNSLIDELPRCILDGRESAGGNVSADPRFLFGGQGDYQARSYLTNGLEITQIFSGHPAINLQPGQDALLATT